MMVSPTSDSNTIDTSDGVVSDSGVLVPRTSD